MIMNITSQKEFFKGVGAGAFLVQKTCYTGKFLN